MLGRLPRPGGERIKEIGESGGHRTPLLRPSPSPDRAGQTHSAKRDQRAGQQQREEPHPPVVAPLQDHRGGSRGVVPSRDGVAQLPGRQRGDRLRSVARGGAAGRSAPRLRRTAGHLIADAEARLPCKGTTTVGSNDGPSHKALAQNRAVGRQEVLVNSPLRNRHTGEEQACKDDPRGEQGGMERGVTERGPGRRAGPAMAALLAEKPRESHQRTPRRLGGSRSGAAGRRLRLPYGQLARG